MSSRIKLLFFISLILLVVGLSRANSFQADNNKQIKGTISNIATEVETALIQEAEVINSIIDNPIAEEEVSFSLALYSVTQVVDGDTIKVLMNGKVETIRLIGMDTPETVDPRKPVQCFGQEASARAKDLLSGQRVALEADSSQGDRDKYDRLLRYVYLEDGQMFNKLMISEGYAHEYTYNSNPYKYQLEFQAAEAEARESEYGLWAQSACAGVTNETAETVSAPSPVVAKVSLLEADNSSGPQVKKSKTDICHQKGSTYYNQTTNYEAFNSLDDCLASGGRLPKR